MKSEASYHTNAIRCDCCSAPIKAIIQLGCGEDNPRACWRHLPKLFAMVDIDAAPAFLSVQVVA